MKETVFVCRPFSNWFGTAPTAYSRCPCSCCSAWDLWPVSNWFGTAPTAYSRCPCSCCSAWDLWPVSSRLVPPTVCSSCCSSWNLWHISGRPAPPTVCSPAPVPPGIYGTSPAGSPHLQYAAPAPAVSHGIYGTSPVGSPHLQYTAPAGAPAFGSQFQPGKIASHFVYFQFSSVSAQSKWQSLLARAGFCSAVGCSPADGNELNFSQEEFCNHFLFGYLLR